MVYDQAYTLQVVRDLAWAVKSPQLIRDNVPDDEILLSDQTLQDWYRKLVPKLEKLDSISSGSSDRLNPQHFHRLGHYFEALVATAIQLTPGLELLERNLQVEGSGQTKGEFDFLIRRDKREVEHWEAAVKFYLLNGDGKRAVSWIGPNPADRLDRKADKLFGRQLKLSKQPEAKEILGHKPVTVHLLFKGYLFYPLALNRGEVPEMVSPNHLKGWWCYAGERGRLVEKANDLWKLLPRMQWLSPAVSETGENLMNNRQLMNRLEKLEKGGPPLLAARLRKVGRRWMETDRGFVVGPDWP